MLKKKNRKVKQAGGAVATDSCDDIDMSNSTMEGDDSDLIVEEIQNPKATKFLKKKGKTEDHLPLLPGVSQVVKHEVCSRNLSVSNGNANGVPSLSSILPVTECREM